MRVCVSCGRENPDDRDFCDCGEDVGVLLTLSVANPNKTDVVSAEGDNPAFEQLAVRP